MATATCVGNRPDDGGGRRRNEKRARAWMVARRVARRCARLPQFRCSMPAVRRLSRKLLHGLEQQGVEACRVLDLRNVADVVDDREIAMREQAHQPFALSDRSDAVELAPDRYYGHRQ